MLVVHAASSPMTLSLFVDNSSRHYAKAVARFLYLAGNERVSGQLRGETLKVTLPRGYLFFLAWLSSGATLKKVLAVSPDVVHVHTPATALGLVWVLRGLKRKNVRLVYTARGGFDEGRRWVTRALWHVVDPVLWGLGHALGVVNHYLLEGTQKTSQDADMFLLSLGGGRRLMFRPLVRSVDQKSEYLSLRRFGLRGSVGIRGINHRQIFPN